MPPEAKRRTGMKLVTGFPEGAEIMSMVEFKGKLMVATTEGVYEVKDNKATKLKLIEKEINNDSEQEPTRTD